MGVWSVLFMSAMPVFRLLVHCGIGAYLSSPKSNVMPLEARKHLNKLVFVCFMPSLIFSNLAQTVTVEKMLDWWFMPINVLLCYMIGAGIGVCIYDHFKPPPHLKKLIIACCATGNSSNLPLVLISAICVEAGSPFGRYDVCSANGVAYISYGLWMATVLTWTVVFNYLKPEPEPEQQEYEQANALPAQDDAPATQDDEDASQFSLALVASKDFSAFQTPQPFATQAAGPQGFLNSGGGVPGFSDSYGPFNSGPQAFHAGMFQGQGYHPARPGFQSVPMLPAPGFHQSFSGAPVPGPQGFHAGPRHSQGFNDYDGYQIYPSPAVIHGFQAPPVHPGPSAFSSPPQTFINPAAAQAGASRVVPGAQQHELHHLSDDFSLANLQMWVEKYRVKEAFTPPTTAAAIAIPIGAMPFLRHLLYGHEAPFRFFGDALVILGEAMIPCMNLLLGGNLSQGFGASELQLEVVICVMLTRLLLLPIAGLIVVKLAFSMGLVPADPLFHFVLLLQFTMPTAINVGTMTQLFGVGQTECTVILFWCYVSSIVFLTLWTMIFLVLLI